MNDFLRSLIGLPPERGGAPPPAVDRPVIAAATLMVEAARLDGRFTPEERRRIETLLIGRFGLAPAVAAGLLAEAERRSDASVDWHHFTREIKDGFDAEGRVMLLEMLWEVVYADGVLHDYEASLMRRVAGLLYISDGESAEARRRALARSGGGGA